MTRSSDNLVSPFVDGELPAGETKPGDLAPILRLSPFASLNLAQRRPSALPVETPPPEAPPPGETAEVEASPILELAFEETGVPESESADLGELAFLSEGFLTEEGVSTEEDVSTQEGVWTELEGFETEAEAFATEEAGFDFESELDRELQEALELEPELESDLALQPESPFEPEEEEARGPEHEAPEPEVVAELAGGSEAGEEEGEKPPGTITIVLDQPSEADDTFTLKSKDDAHRKVFGPKDAQALVAGAKVLRFAGADTTKEYQLFHKRSAASAERPIFAAPMAFVWLTEHHTARSPRALEPLRTEAPAVTPGHPVDPSLIDPSPGFVHLTDVRL